MTDVLAVPMLAEAGQMPGIFTFFAIATALVLIAGFYSILVSINLIRTLIGLEILTKAITLLIIVAGYRIGQVALAQAMVITLIIIEVVVMVVAVGVVLCIYRNDRTIDAGVLRNLKG
jgi:multisubunit Na+/H+ antiporter MnhC subunit